MRAGAQDYLVKPFSPVQVRLGNLLTLHRTRRLLPTELASSQHNIEQLARMLATRRRELETINVELQAIGKQQSNFVAIVSHEFRTTLTGIQGFSELLSEHEWSSQDVKGYATDILTNTRRLTRMINDVLDLEHIKLGKMTLRYEAVDVNTLLSDLAKQTQPIAPKHTLTCRLDRTLPLVPADRDKCIQVITNLLSNA